MNILKTHQPAKTQSVNIPESTEQHEERRNFARLLLSSALALYTGTLVYGVWRYLRSPSEHRTPTPPLAINAAALERHSALPMRFGDRTILLRRTNSDSTTIPYRAFHLRCTHAGCTVEWRTAEQKFVCPCHGAEFDANGQPIRLPATEALEEFLVQQGKNGAWEVRDNIIR